MVVLYGVTTLVPFNLTEELTSGGLLSLLRTKEARLVRINSTSNGQACAYEFQASIAT